MLRSIYHFCMNVGVPLFVQLKNRAVSEENKKRAKGENVARNTEKPLNKRSASTAIQVVEGCQNTAVEVAQHWNFSTLATTFKSACKVFPML